MNELVEVSLARIAKSMETLADLGTAMLKLKMAEMEASAGLNKPESASTATDRIAAELKRQKEAFKNRGQG